MINPGKYIAKVESMKFGKAETGTSFVEVLFNFKEQDGANQNLGWRGYLSEAAMPRTMKILTEVLQFNGDDELTSDGYFKKSAFPDIEVEIVIEHNTYNGKTWPRIKWINTIGKSGFEGLAPQVVKSELASTGFKAAFLATKAGKPAVTSFAPDEDAPF